MAAHQRRDRRPSRRVRRARAFYFFFFFFFFAATFTVALRPRVASALTPRTVIVARVRLGHPGDRELGPALERQQPAAVAERRADLVAARAGRRAPADGQPRARAPGLQALDGRRPHGPRCDVARDGQLRARRAVGGDERHDLARAAGAVGGGEAERPAAPLAVPIRRAAPLPCSTKRDLLARDRLDAVGEHPRAGPAARRPTRGPTASRGPAPPSPPRSAPSRPRARRSTCPPPAP